MEYRHRLLRSALYEVIWHILRPCGFEEPSESSGDPYYLASELLSFRQAAKSRHRLSTALVVSGDLRSVVRDFAISCYPWLSAEKGHSMQ